MQVKGNVAQDENGFFMCSAYRTDSKVETDATVSSTVQGFGASPEMLHSEHWKPVLDNNIKECTGCTLVDRLSLNPENICSS